QDFIPAPFDVATCMYYTGIDPFTKKEVKVARHLGERKLQRALLQFFKPENYFEVREALERANRRDLIGNGCNALIPASAPPEAIILRREKANMLANMRMEGKAADRMGRRSAGNSTGPSNKGYRPFRKEWTGAGAPPAVR